MVVKPRLITANTSENCFMMHRANLSVTLIVKDAVLPIRFCYWTSDVNVLNVVSLRALVRKGEIYIMNDF